MPMSSLSAKNGPVEGHGPRRRVVPVEALAELQPATALGLRPPVVVEQLLDGAGEAARVARLDERRRVSGHLLQGRAPRADDGQTRRHRLRHRKPEAFLEGGENEKGRQRHPPPPPTARAPRGARPPVPRPAAPPHPPPPAHPDPGPARTSGGTARRRRAS